MLLTHPRLILFGTPTSLQARKFAQALMPLWIYISHSLCVLTVFILQYKKYKLSYFGWQENGTTSFLTSVFKFLSDIFK